MFTRDELNLIRNALINYHSQAKVNCEKVIARTEDFLIDYQQIEENAIQTAFNLLIKLEDER